MAVMYESMVHGEVVEANRFQPMMVVTSQRLECDCGALAIYQVLALDEGQEHAAHAFFCQSCFEKMQEEAEE